VTDKNLIDLGRKANPRRDPRRFRALSLFQPWAWAVVHGPKWIENRTWWADLRGELVLHASAQVTPQRYREARETILRIAASLELELEVPHRDDLTYGAIVGRARVVDAILPGGWRPLYRHQSFNWNAITHYRLEGETWGKQARGGATTGRHVHAGAAWHFADQYGYELADRRPLVEPIAWRGHQKGWRVPVELEIEILRRDLAPARPEPETHCAACGRARRGVTPALFVCRYCLGLEPREVRA
jgi:hypothetical protein